MSAEAGFGLLNDVPIFMIRCPNYCWKEDFSYMIKAWNCLQDFFPVYTNQLTQLY